MATKVRSIRASEEVWARLDARAAAEGVPANVLAVRYWEAGLSRGTETTTEGTAEKPPARAKPVAAKAGAVKRIAVPKVEAQASAPKADGLTEAQRAVRAIHAPPPERPAYGSMLKKPKAVRRG